MELKQIQTFITIVEWGSFSEAAKQLYLSQPTVSLHIKQLEQELGIELISRTTKSHELTVQGEEFYKYAQSLLKMANNIETTFSQKNSHRVTIGASSIAAGYILPPLLMSFSEEHQEKQIKLIQNDTINIINDIALGSLNIGIVGSRAMNNNLVFDQIYTDTLVIATPYNDYYLNLKEKNASLEEILSNPFISREEGSGTLKESAMVLRSLNLDPHKLNIMLEVNNNDTIKHFISLGAGISIISGLAVEDEVEQKKILTFKMDHNEALRDFYLVYRKNTHLPDASRELIAFIKRYFGKN